MAEAGRTERRTKKRSFKTQVLELRLSYEDSGGVHQVVSAFVVDSSDLGLGLQLRSALPPGTSVTLKAGPELIASGIALQPKARVCWCRPGVGGVYRVGLLFEKQSQSRAAGAPAEGDLEQDLYEILQVNPKADPDTIHRVFRLMAQRYHPDNQESGDEEVFKLLMKAYEVLGDPARRAAYDVQREQQQQQRFRIFRTPESAKGHEAERAKRRGVLMALYNKRLQEIHSPALSMFELEDLLGVPREHLEFTVWYLKERALITRSDNNRFQITIGGVDYAEELEDRERAGRNGDSLEDRHRLLTSPAAR
jgi:hypothetical protein